MHTFLHDSLLGLAVFGSGYAIGWLARLIWAAIVVIRWK